MAQINDRPYKKTPLGEALWLFIWVLCGYASIHRAHRSAGGTGGAFFLIDKVFVVPGRNCAFWTFRFARSAGDTIVCNCVSSHGLDPFLY